MMDKHVFWGLLIPVIFFFFAGMVKSLVKNQWIWSNFYLGIDISLAALANGIINIVDGVNQNEKHLIPNPDFASQMFYTSICIVVGVAALLGTMGLHQRFDVPTEENSNQRWKRGILLGGVSNLIGMAVLATFIIMKLRGAI
jgi:hypothetical protein